MNATQTSSRPEITHLTMYKIPFMLVLPEAIYLRFDFILVKQSDIYYRLTSPINPLE